jgi:hypothetical protein
MGWRIVPVVLAFLLLAAHFLRGDAFTLVAVSLLAPLLLFIHRRPALRLVQGLLFLGAGVWLLTAAVVGRQRVMLQEPWLRMALILGAVALLTIWAGVLLNGSRVKDRYP